MARDNKTGKFISVQPCSEGDDIGKWGTREKTQRKRKAPDEPTIEETLRPIPACLEEIEDAPTAQSTASAIEWLADIETIRGRSSYQGVLSRRIKERVAALRKVLEVFAVRVEEKGDLEYYKRRNQELQGQLLASHREMKRIDRRINELQRTIEELKGFIINEGGTKKVEGAERMAKPTTSTQEIKTMLERGKERQNVESLPPVRRPPIQGVSSVILERSRSRDIQEDADISRQIVNLVNRRKALRERMERSSNHRLGEGIQTGEKGPRIILNVQLVPPQEGKELAIEEVAVRQLGIPVANRGFEWVKVVSNKNKRKQVKKEQKETEQLMDKEKEGIKKKSKREGDGKKKPGQQRIKSSQQGVRKKPPRTAAVAIRGVGPNISYAEALKNLRGKISLPELEIERSHIRKAASGGILIEISGEERNKKAEELKNRIAGVLGEAAKVTRPTVKGEDYRI